jgi:hypothetical protein
MTNICSGLYGITIRAESRQVVSALLPGSPTLCTNKFPRCMVMDDDFTQGLDQFWTREVRLDGWG